MEAIVILAHQENGKAGHDYMLYQVKLEPIEIEIPADCERRIVEEEVKRLGFDMNITMYTALRELVINRINRIIKEYDSKKMDYIREQLGLTDEK